MKKSVFSPWLRLTVILLSCALLVAALLPVIKPPFAVVFAGLALASLLCCIYIKKKWVTYATMILLPLFVVASIMEFHLLAMRAPGAEVREQGTFKSTWDRDDALHGYGPKKERSQSTHDFYRGDKRLFSATYTTDDEGRRITPVHPQADTDIVFFGCSFTYGIGVEDDEAFPYKVGEILGDKYQVCNYAFTGYGSHQFLASLESGILDNLARTYKNIYVFYLNINLHEMRPAGYSEWDLDGPRYVLKDGKALRQGNFAPWWNQSPLARQIYDALKQSFLFREVLIRPHEIFLKKMCVLDNAIMLQAQQHIVQNYSNATFTLLVYPNAQHHIPLQKEMGLRPTDTSQFFPLPPTDARYVIPEEWHPSAEAHRVLAEGIARLVQDSQHTDATAPAR